VEVMRHAGGRTSEANQWPGSERFGLLSGRLIAAA
jgi:hypothetical protein